MPARDRARGRTRRGRDHPRGRKAVAVQGDVSKAADVKRLFAEAIRSFGRLDVLVNNAGVYSVRAAESITEAEFTGTTIPTSSGRSCHPGGGQALGPEGGSVVNIGSVLGSSPWPQAAIYVHEGRRRQPDPRPGRSVSAPAEGPGQRRGPRHHRVRGHVRLHLFEGDEGKKVIASNSARPHWHAGRHRPRGRLPGFPMTRPSPERSSGHPAE